MNFIREQIKIYKSKISAVITICRAPGLQKSLNLSPDNEAKVVIEEVLRKRLRIENADQSLALKTAADEILSRLKKPPEQATNERIEALLDGILNQSLWFHSQLAAITTAWEFRVRMFAVKLGISSNVPIGEKSKKHRANRSVEHKTLSDVIKEINKKTNNRLSLKLLEMAELRNAIVHCNPQGIRAYAVPLLGKEALKTVKGGVVVLNLNSGSITDLSEIKDEVDIEHQDTIGWFIEIFNSNLPKMAFALFEESALKLNLLTEFSAISFDNRRVTFENLIYKGIYPDENSIKLFKDYFASDNYPVHRDADKFFREVTQCFYRPK